LSANVDIQTNRGNDLLTLPIECVTTRVSSTKNSTSADVIKDEIVFVVVNGIANKRKVTTGIQDNSFIEIKSGINLKEKIISGPYDILSTTLDSGRKVKVVKKEDLFEVKK
jgi:HlyD family secretion protein